jgi:tetratricopeptide (TPR) repeat protein
MTRKRAATLIAGVLALLVVWWFSSRRSSDSPSAPSAGPAASGSATSLRMAPQGQDRVPTTAGTIFVKNFESQLRWAEDAVARDPDSQEPRRMLAGLLATSGKYRGDIEQIQRAVDAVDACLRVEPDDADLWLARANHAQALHRFAEARANVERARKLGAKGHALHDLVQELDWNDGRYEPAIASIRAAARERPSFETLARLAQLEHDLGRMEDADRAFEAAEDRFKDVNPLPLAWLYVERGRHELDRGEPARAVAFLREATVRAPGYVPAEEHLAEALGELGKTDEAVKLYRSIIARSPDPEFVGALAALLRKSGKPDEASELAAKARARYDELLERWPEAMYWHAAEFFLEEGKDPARAVALLEKNVEVRPNGESWAALARAQLATGNAQAARPSIEKALATPFVSAEMLWTASRIYAAVGDDGARKNMEERARRLNPHIEVE